MQIRVVFIDVDNRNEELEHLPHGEYQVIGDPTLSVNPSLDEHDRGDTEYTFKYRVGRID